MHPEEQAFAAAAQALDPSTEDPAALAAARSALSALLATPEPLPGKLAALSDLADALQTLQAAGTTDSYIPNAVAALEDIRGVAADTSSIAAALRALQGSYTAASPCIAALLSRAQHVNNSVLVLPAEIDHPAALLADAQARLDRAYLQAGQYGQYLWATSAKRGWVETLPRLRISATALLWPARLCPLASLYLRMGCLRLMHPTGCVLICAAPLAVPRMMCRRRCLAWLPPRHRPAAWPTPWMPLCHWPK